MTYTLRTAGLYAGTYPTLRDAVEAMLDYACSFDGPVLITRPNGDPLDMEESSDRRQAERDALADMRESEEDYADGERDAAAGRHDDFSTRRVAYLIGYRHGLETGPRLPVLRGYSFRRDPPGLLRRLRFDLGHVLRRPEAALAWRHLRDTLAVLLTINAASRGLE